MKNLLLMIFMFGIIFSNDVEQSTILENQLETGKWYVGTSISGLNDVSLPLIIGNKDRNIEFKMDLDYNMITNGGNGVEVSSVYISGFKFFNFKYLDKYNTSFKVGLSGGKSKNWQNISSDEWVLNSRKYNFGVSFGYSIEIYSKKNLTFTLSSALSILYEDISNQESNTSQYTTQIKNQDLIFGIRYYLNK